MNTAFVHRIINSNTQCWRITNSPEASQYLKGLLGCEVDLIANHRLIRPFFKKQIEQDGIDIFGS